MASPPPPPPPYPPGTSEYNAWAAQNRGPEVLILCWLFVALATVFMAGRLYARMHLFGKLKSDDYWCLASIFCSYLASCFTTVAVSYGNGKHVQTLSIYQAEQVRLWNFAAFMPGVLVLGLPKVAVVILLNRLLNPSKWHRRFLWVMVVLCVLSNIATVGTLAGQCTPTKAMWNFDMDAKCIDPNIIIGFSLYSAAFNAFVDLYLAVYPAIVLFKLQLKLRKKMALSVALGVGAVGGIVAIVKATQIPAGLGSPDFSYASADLVYWSIIEASTIIIAATIPTLSPLIEKIFKGRNPFRSISKGISKGSSKQRQSYAKHSHDSHVDPFAPRRKTRDPDGLGSLELQDTIVADSSEENILPIQKPREGDLESQHSYSNSRSSDSTEVPPMQEQQSVRGILRTNEVSVTYDSPHNPNAQINSSPWSLP